MASLWTKNSEIFQLTKGSIVPSKRPIHEPLKITTYDVGAENAGDAAASASPGSNFLGAKLIRFRQI